LGLSSITKRREGEGPCPPERKTGKAREGKMRVFMKLKNGGKTKSDQNGKGNTSFRPDDLKKTY